MPVLAFYTIRSKQAYIFRNNSMVEITGGSRLIAAAFDRLFEAAEQAGCPSRRCVREPAAFSAARVKEAFASGAYRMVELFAGGGNCTVLFDSRETWLRVNRAYTRRLLEGAPGMIPMCAGIETDLSDYDADWKKLQAEAEREKNRMMPRQCSPMTPFSLLDRKTGDPITRTNAHRDSREISAESGAKFDMGWQAGERSTLDGMTEKGRESLIAIVHIDGNAMGQKVRALLNGDPSYDRSVSTMRAFTAKVTELFARAGCGAVEAAANAVRDTEEARKVRWVIRDGDDVTFVCRARHALTYTRAFLNVLAQAAPDPAKRYTACAGICVIHSHYPFHMAYEVAEDACESAKARMREAMKDEEACWIDFQYLRGGAAVSLKELRARERTANLMARPLLADQAHVTGALTLRMLDEMAAAFRDERGSRLSGARGNIKALGVACEQGENSFQAEWARVCERTPHLKEKAGAVTQDESALRKLLYDLADVYDLWFAEEGRDVPC